MSQLELLEQAFLNFDEKVSQEFFKFMGDNEGKSFNVNNVPVIMDSDFDEVFDSSYECVPRIDFVNKLICEEQNYHFLTKSNSCQWDVEFLTAEGMSSILMDILQSGQV